MRTPLFFKLWFAFVAIMALAISAATVYVIYSAATNPAAIGEFFGKVVTGYQGAAPAPTPIPTG